MERKRDILFLCQYFYPEYVSSATLPYDTAMALTKEGFSVSVLCGYPKEYNNREDVPKRETHNGIEIRRLRYLQLQRTNIIGRLINYFSFTFAVFLNFFNLRNYKSIIVYSNPPVLPLIVAWADKLFRTKVIFVSYDVYPEVAHVTNSTSENGLISRIMRFINKEVFSHVDKVVALSNEMKQYLLDHRKQLDEEQVVVIPNWYEDNPAKSVGNPHSNEKFISLDSENNFIVSYFGNMGTCQDLDTILEAIRTLKQDRQIKFVFAGHGNKMEDLRRTVVEENLDNTVIYDFLHGQDFQDALNISDCFLVSLAEGLTGLGVPSKTYSYMMAGKPVLAIIGAESDIAKDLRNNKAGYSVEVGETQKLVDAIAELKNNEDKCEQMGKNCRDVFLRKYTKKHCTKQYVSLVNTILGSESLEARSNV